jgi:VIT1/CCC1 family predicted Fe2+/Mn2+ transporter
LLGGGAAGAVQAGTVLARLKSTLFTGGFGNLAVALLELAGAALLSLLAILAPVLVLLVLAALAWLLARIVRVRRLAARAPADRGPAGR